MRGLASRGKDRKVLPFLQETTSGASDSDNNSQLAQLSFYQKDPASWNIVDGGASGSMKYNRFNGELDFVFNGQGLEPELAYGLVYSPNARHEDGLVVLGSTTADSDGNVHLSGSMAVTEFMQGYKSPDVSGLWLVLAADVDLENARMTGWSPRHYLFGHDIFTFGDELGV